MISSHTVYRWKERVAPDATLHTAAGQIEAFLATAKVEGKARAWMRRHDTNARGVRVATVTGVTEPEPDVDYAYNDEWPGVCLIVTRTKHPVVLTVLTRAGEREHERVHRTYEAGRQAHATQRRLGKRSRRISARNS